MARPVVGNFRMSSNQVHQEIPDEVSRLWPTRSCSFRRCDTRRCRYTLAVRELTAVLTWELRATRRLFAGLSHRRRRRSSNSSKQCGRTRCSRLPVAYMMDPSARIVLVEDHAILREGLRALIELEPDLKVVGEASTGAEGVRVAQRAGPTLVITDLAMPGGWGLRTIDELRAACPNLRVLVLTAYCTDEYIGAAWSAGADGYVLKYPRRAELLQAIRSVIAGQKYFSEPVSARVMSGYLRRNDPATLASPRITEPEREVLTRIALGESNRRIAVALRLSVKTVEKHRANLMRKLELHNTAAVALFALRNGLLPARDVAQCFAELELLRFRGRLNGSGRAHDGRQDGPLRAEA